MGNRNTGGSVDQTLKPANSDRLSPVELPGAQARANGITSDPNDPAVVNVPTSPHGPITGQQGGVIGSPVGTGLAERAEDGTLTPGPATRALSDEDAADVDDAWERAQRGDHSSADPSADHQRAGKARSSASSGRSSGGSVASAFDSLPPGSEVHVRVGGPMAAPAKNLDKTVPGGLYLDARGRWKNAEGQLTTEDGTVLTAKEVAALIDAE